MTKTDDITMCVLILLLMHYYLNVAYIVFPFYIKILNANNVILIHCKIIIFIVGLTREFAVSSLSKEI